MAAIKLLTAFDLLAFNWCLQLPKASQMARASRQISRLGDGGFYLALGILLALFDRVNGVAFLVTGLATYLFELPLYSVLKNIIKRDRPCEALAIDAYIRPPDKFSFPSGHAAAAFVFATLIASFYPSFAVLAYTLAGLVGVSRILLGVHYPSDIVAGALLGMGCAVLMLSYMPDLTVLL